MIQVLIIACGSTIGLLLATWALNAWRQFCSRHATSPAELPDNPDLYQKIVAHFQPVDLTQVVIAERRFAFRMRADLQQAVDALFREATTVEHFSSVRQTHGQQVNTLLECLIDANPRGIVTVPPEYEELDIGENRPVRVLQCGFWLAERGGQKFVMFLRVSRGYSCGPAILCQIATIIGDQGRRLCDEIFHRLEDSVRTAASYRGKILSLERDSDSYSGASCGIKVHRLRAVDREQVILPSATLALMDRNVIDFVRRRQALFDRGQSTKKGLLFYGPPGTGKTHTIHYLTRALPNHTTLLITAEQVGLLTEYVALARLLQPTMLVIEDADLIARDRNEMNTCEELLLNKLLNEMDGLREQADVLFILTTNRPEALERALASRPGRIDQAVEFPVPDAIGREKLVGLYAAGMEVPNDVRTAIVAKTNGVSAAFIKELMRRSLQFQLERDGDGALHIADVDAALTEMLFSGGSLNLKLLGAENAETTQAA